MCDVIKLKMAQLKRAQNLCLLQRTLTATTIEILRHEGTAVWGGIKFVNLITNTTKVLYLYAASL